MNEWLTVMTSSPGPTPTASSARCSAVPGLRAALHLDDPAVRAAYEHRYGRPPDDLFTTRLGAGDRLRWAVHALTTALDRLPPFWLTVVLTVTVSLPVSMLGLPIAASAMGALPALVLLAVVGLVMSIAMGALGEAIARSADVRYRHAFLGGLATKLIGGRASIVLTGTGGVRSGLSLLAGWIGLSITVAEVTHTPRGIWAVLLLVVVILMLTRGAKLALGTVAMVGVLTTVLVLVVTLVTFLNAGAGDLSHADVPLGGGNAALDATVGAALGVILMQFIGSVYLIGIHREAAARDPGSATLAAGAVVGTVIVTVIVGPVPRGGQCRRARRRSARHQRHLHRPAGRPARAGHGRAGRDHVGPAAGDNINRTAVAVHALTLERVTRVPMRWRSLAALAPVLLIFGVAETLLDLGDASFSSVLTISGVVTNVLVGAAIPMLLIVAARRRGELVPPRVWRWLGWPPLAWAIVAVSLASLVVVGLFVCGRLGLARRRARHGCARRGHRVLGSARGGIAPPGRGRARRRSLGRGGQRTGAAGRRRAPSTPGARRSAHAAGGAVEPGLSALRVSAPAANQAREVEVWSDGVVVADADVTPPDRDGAWSAAVRLSPRTG